MPPSLTQAEKKEDGLTLIVFSLGPEFYALQLQEVREIIPLPNITPLPNVPPYILGIIPLRSEILSVLDLRRYLRLSTASEKSLKKKPKNYVLILEEGLKTLGLLIDGKTEAVEFAREKIQRVPLQKSPEKSSLVKEEFDWRGKLVGILDIHKILHETRNSPA